MGFTEMVIEQALSTSPFGTRIPDISRKDFYLLEEFTQAIKSRPLRIRVQPPNCGAALPSAVRVGAREQRHLEPGPQVRS